MNARSHNPLITGTWFALSAALAFGATTPLVQQSGRGVGPFTTAALLYAGATLFALRPRSRSEAPLRLHDAKRLLASAFLGAMLAPVALVWGLARSSGVAASLLLNTEGFFTVLLARAVWGEKIGLRAGLALVSMAAAGALLVSHGSDTSSHGAWGSVAVLIATLGWASDNVVARPLADRDPNRVVLVKSALGAAMSVTLSRVFRESQPNLPTCLALAALGAVGYGASLNLYLRAQRLVGAARTGSIFAAAPFLGACFAWALGEHTGGMATIFAGGLSAISVALHLGEAHKHEHRHETLSHEHAHTHDDGHHQHEHVGHDASLRGSHSHPHEHSALTHAHPHGPDLHHRHEH